MATTQKEINNISNYIEYLDFEHELLKEEFNKESYTLLEESIEDSENIKFYIIKFDHLIQQIKTNREIKNKLEKLKKEKISSFDIDTLLYDFCKNHNDFIDLFSTPTSFMPAPEYNGVIINNGNSSLVSQTKDEISFKPLRGQRASLPIIEDSFFLCINEEPDGGLSSEEKELIKGIFEEFGDVSSYD